MTSPVGLVDLEEDDRVIPIENSHLSRARCSCGAVALVAPGRRGRCGACRRADADAGPGVEPTPRNLPPLGQGHPPRVSSGRADYPAPEFTSRQECSGAVPAPVEKLAEKARKAGWRAKVQASRGQAPNASTGHPGLVKTLYGVVIGNGRYGAYAVRDSTTWGSVMLWGHDRTWFSLANVTELGEYIEAGGEMPDAWYAGVRRRVAEAEQRKADRALCDKGLHRAKYLSQTPGPLYGTWCDLCSHSWPRGASAWKKPKKGKEDTAR